MENILWMPLQCTGVCPRGCLRKGERRRGGRLWGGRLRRERNKSEERKRGQTEEISEKGWVGKIMGKDC